MGRSRNNVLGHPAGNATSSGSGDFSVAFPGALPPATFLCPCRAHDRAGKGRVPQRLRYSLEVSVSRWFLRATPSPVWRRRGNQRGWRLIPGLYALGYVIPPLTGLTSDRCSLSVGHLGIDLFSGFLLQGGLLFGRHGIPDFDEAIDLLLFFRPL